MDFLLIIAGLFLLFAGGEALIRGSVAISERLGISAILIGVVIVGFGTSTPELLVSIKASLADQPDIALGNVVGSNIANILLILGVAAMITPVICKDKAIKRDAIAVLVATIILFALTYFQVVSRPLGGLMILTLTGYLIFSYISERKSKLVTQSSLGAFDEGEVQEYQSKWGIGLSVLLSVIGIAMLVFGADFLVKGASSIARNFGVSEAVIGLSLVAVGTSLPELAASIAAAMKKNSDVIIGNILGSNLFNILCILGVTALIKPIPLEGQIIAFDIPIALGVAIVALVIIFMFHKFSRITGLIFLSSYAAYISWLFIGG